MTTMCYVKSTHKGIPTIWEGTMKHFIDEVFGYTLECGHSWNAKIPLQPKSVKSLVNALNKSADECRRYSDFYEVSSKEEFDNATGYDYTNHTGVNRQEMR